MPRKGPATKSPVIADPVYNSPVVTALINKVLLHGKRSTAEAIVYDALEGVREKTQVDPIITNATRRHPEFARTRDDRGEFEHPDERTYSTIRGQENLERIQADRDAIASERRRRALLPSSPSRLALTYDVPPRGMGPEDGIPPRRP